MLSISPLSYVKPPLIINTNPFFLSDDSNTWFGQFCWASKGGSMNGVVVSSVSEEVCWLVIDTTMLVLLAASTVSKAAAAAAEGGDMCRPLF